MTRNVRKKIFAAFTGLLLVAIVLAAVYFDIPVLGSIFSWIVILPYALAYEETTTTLYIILFTYFLLLWGLTSVFAYYIFKIFTEMK